MREKSSILVVLTMVGAFESRNFWEEDIYNPHLSQAHLRELLASGIDEEVARLNNFTVSGDPVYQFLLEPAYNKGVKVFLNNRTINSYWRRKYSHCEDGGWFASAGINVLTGEYSQWGQFKPDRPRRNHFGKIIKYETCPKVKTSIYAPKLPSLIAKRLLSPFGIETGDKIDSKEFWRHVIADSSIPLIITEGAKKAQCLLSFGYVAIALPGIFNGYRNDPNTGIADLIPELKVFAQKDREIIFCFDNDTKPKTVKAVRTATIKTGDLFKRYRVKVTVVTWNEREYKGVDDLIVGKGVKYFSRCFKERKPLQILKQKYYTDISSLIDVELNSRYIPENLTIPQKAQLICLKSGKGTGKTNLLENIVLEARAEGVGTLVLGHRIQLLRHLCERFDLPYVDEFRKSPGGAIKGMGLCVDSLLKESSANFDPLEWKGYNLVIDEIEQVIWHMLNSSTCQSRRIKILENFTKLVKIVINSGGKIYLADADLSKISIEYIERLIGRAIKRFVVENKYKVNKGRKSFIYEGNDTTKIVKAIVTKIDKGEKVIIHCGGQNEKSTFGTTNLEKIIRAIFPNLNILRLDRVTVSNPEHPAYGCIENLDNFLYDYDVVIASPVIETGVSIESDRFDSVFAIANGVQNVNGILQEIERVRSNIDRHIWISNPGGLGLIGNGSTNKNHLKKSTQKYTQQNILLLKQAGISDDVTNWDSSWSDEHLEAWAAIATLVNGGFKNYKEEIKYKLRESGYELLTPDKNLIEGWEDFQELLYLNKEISYELFRKNVANKQNPDDIRYEQLKQKRAKTDEERHEEIHGMLNRVYGGVEVSPELVEKHDSGWLYRIQLHYYLTIGNQFVAERDTKTLNNLAEDTGKVFSADAQKKCLAIRTYAMEKLGILDFIDPANKKVEYNKNSLAEWLENLNNPMTLSQIKTVLGVTINPSLGGIVALRSLLNKIGYAIEFTRFVVEDSERPRNYRVVCPEDKRDKVFERWLMRDRSS